MGNALRSKSGPRVLVVEDEPFIAFSVEEMLVRMGCLVIGPVPTVARALDLLEREEPEFAVLDVNLRRERVTPVAEALQAREVPYALATAFDPSQLSEEPLSEVPLLGKPIDQRLLQDALADLRNRGFGSGQTSSERSLHYPASEHGTGELETRLLIARHRYEQVRRNLDPQRDLDQDLHGELTRTLQIIDRKIADCADS